MVKQVTLARVATELPNSQRGWLGVMLAEGEDGEQGIVIQDVHRGIFNKGRNMFVGPPRLVSHRFELAPQTICERPDELDVGPER